MTSTTADDIQYMQTGREGTEGDKMDETTEDSASTLMIDPPRKPTTTRRKYSFESSDDDLILTSDDDADYHLSATTSSDDETIASGGLPASVNITKNKSQQNVTSSTNTKTDDAIVTSSAKQPSPKLNPTSKPKRQSTFMDILNEIYEDKPVVPEQSKLGPKPWLMRGGKIPRPVKKYEVSDVQFVYKSKQNQQPKTEAKPTPTQEPQDTNKLVTETTPITNPEPIRAEDDPVYSVPTPRGRMSSASSGNAISDNEKSAKYPSETDTGFVSNASSATSPSNSARNISRLPSGEEVSSDDFYKIAFVNPSLQNSPSYSSRSNSRMPSSEQNPTIMAGDKNNAQELARAALQALSLSKNILQDMEKNKDPRDPDTIYDEVALSPLTSDKRNVYDDVPPHDDVNRKDNKRTVISVPVFKPPAAPTRNDRNNVISSEPIYDITRQAPKSVSTGAMDLMYQLFGNDMSRYNTNNNNNSGGVYGRPASVKSVTFEDEVKSPDGGFPSRPSSRAGSVYSEWSDCTINLPEAAESEASTLPRNTVEFPQFPQIGFSNLPQNIQRPNYPPQPAPQQLRPPYPANQTYPYRAPSNYSQPPQQYPNAPYNPRNQMFPQQGGFLPPQGPYPPSQASYPPSNSIYGPASTPGIRSPVYSSYNPYQATDPHMGHYPRPPHAFSPPRHWGGFSPPQHRRHHHFHKRGRAHARTHRGGRRRGQRSRRNRYSDDEEFSRSPSPVRRQHRDVIDAEAIAGKSYLDGYKAALKDAVITFAERQGLKRITNTVEDKEERMRGRLRRAISAGRIHELPDNVELGDIRKAFGAKNDNKSYSDDDIDDVIENFSDVIRREDDLIVPSAGRPLSRNGSLSRKNERRRHQRYYRDDEAIDDDFSGSEHGESCDCSECEQEFEMAERFHNGEMMSSRPRHPNDITPAKRRDVNDNPRSSPRMNGLRQRYIESLESSASTVRAPVRANHKNPRDGRQDFEQVNLNRRMPDRQGNGYDEIQPRFQGQPGYGPRDQYGPPMTSYNHRGGHMGPPPNNWERGRRVQYGYQ